jgi:hypothetical protein
VVAALNEQGRARRTIKYLSGLLAGAWVVGSTWAAASLAAGAPAPEGDHEAAGDTAGFEGGPREGREMAAAAAEGGGGGSSSGGARLLEGLEMYLAGGCDKRLLTLTRSLGLGH